MKTHLLTIMTITALLSVNATGWAQGLDTPSPDLPPDGKYITLEEYFEYSPFGVIMAGPVLTPLVGTTVRTPVGNDEQETFDAILDAVEIGLGLGPIQLTGPVVTYTTERNLSATGTFATEIISADLSGNTPLGPVIIREDPNRASPGSTGITDIGGGLYHIDSFFDVFTEFSVDGGGTWIASDYAVRMFLVPEPATLGLMLLGIIAALPHRLGRRSK